MAKTKQQLKDYNNKYINTNGNNSIKGVQHNQINNDIIDFIGSITNNENVGLVVDGQGNVITDGSKGYRSIGFDGEIISWSLIGDVDGDIDININKYTYNSFPIEYSGVTNGNSISLSGVDKNESNDLTGWDIEINSGDILEFIVETGVTNITKIWLLININKI